MKTDIIITGLSCFLFGISIGILFYSWLSEQHEKKQKKVEELEKKICDKTQNILEYLDEKLRNDLSIARLIYHYKDAIQREDYETAKILKDEIDRKKLKA